MPVPHVHYALNAKEAGRFAASREQRRDTPVALVQAESMLTGIGATGIFSAVNAMNKARVIALAWMVAVVAAQSIAGSAAESPRKSQRAKLYDTNANGGEQIAAALKTAKAENKRVILHECYRTHRAI